MGVVVIFFTWVVVQIFSLKEAVAVSQTNTVAMIVRQDRMKEKIDKIYDYLITNKK